MGDVAMNPLQIDPSAVHDWPGREIALPPGRISADGVFSKGLGFGDLSGALVPLLIAIPVFIGLSAAFLRKQER